jgi:hypothetical protein
MKVWVVFEGYSEGNDYVDGNFMGVISDEIYEEYRKENPEFTYFPFTLKQDL